MRRPSLAALCLLLVACSGTTGSRTSSPSTVRTASPSPSPSIPTATATLVPTPCDAAAPTRARCSTLRVPVDYAHPKQGDISLAVIVLPATDAQGRIGALLTNPGGPGGSGVEFLEQQGRALAALNRDFDLVSWDPRGVTGADAVSCVDTATMDQMVHIDPIADDPGEHQALVDGARQFATACGQRSARLLPHVGTADVARDMDLLRAALGEDKLTYLGFSYGTDIGARYAAMFPTHIRAMVLDGDIDPSLSSLQMVEQQSDSLEAELRDFVAACRASAACPLNPDPMAAIDQVLARLDAHDALVNGRTYGRGDALVALVAAMYDPRGWPQAWSIFGAAVQGDDTRMQALTDAYTGRKPSGIYDHSMESGTAVGCVDNPRPAADFAALDAAAARAQQRDPHIGDAAVYGVSPCMFWPVHGPAPQPLHVTGAPAIVLVGATGDPATPYAWSQSLQRQIQGSVLITRRGDGHTSYIRSACIADMVNAYLETLRVPGDGAVCAG